MRNLKKFLALVLATLMIVGAMVATTVSAAEADHTDAVEVLNRIDVYRGYGADVMGDKDLVTRWHMALFVSRMTTGFTNDSVWNVEANDTPFTDVTKDNYLGAISSAYKAGIILGVGDNKFDPNANIKYQDALTMVVRALGYKDLEYPLGYIKQAQALGLTDNLNELDNKLDTAITRGQTAEILYNALFVAGKDGIVLGTDVLKLKLADVTVVATPNQTFGASELAPAGKVVLYNAAKEEYFTVAATELLEDGEKADDLLGYSFKVATNNNWQTLVTAYRCASATLYNYGDEKNDIKYVQVGYAPNITYRDNAIKLSGTNYNWNDNVVSKSYNKFIAFRTTAAAQGTSTAKIFYYDTDKNIVDPVDGTVLLYNLDGVYYINVGTADFQALRSASAAEIEAAKRDLYISTGNLDSYETFECYEQIQDVADLWNNKFCELKVFDDNGDGKWDRGIFTPYFIGEYTTSGTALSVDGTRLKVQKPAAAAVNATINSNATVTGVAAAAGDTILYTYNAFTGEFVVKANLGTLKSGRATEINGRGSYVVIDGNKLSYALTEDNLKGWEAADIRIPLLQAVITDGTYVVDYIAAAGYLLQTSTRNPYGYTNYVAFDFENDIVNIDASGNLVVKAIIDATGVKKEVKISDVINYKVGARLAYGLANAPATTTTTTGTVNSDQFYVGYNPGSAAAATAAATKAKIVEQYEKAVAGNDGMTTAMADYFKDKTVFAGRLNSDGTYSLVNFTPLTAYDPVNNKNDKDEINIVDNKAAKVITLNYGINNNAYVTSVASEDKLIATAGKFDTTSSAVYIFAGKDEIHVYTGVAKNGSTIDLTGDNTVLLNATADCVFVYDGTKDASELYTGWTPATTPTPTVLDKDYVFYTVVKDTKAYVNNAVAADKATLTITGLRNVLTGESTDFVITADYATVVNPIFEEINAKWDVTDASQAAGSLIVFSKEESLFNISTLDATVFDKFEEYFDAAYATSKYPTKYAQANLGNLNEQYAISIDGATVPVQSFALTTFWGDGTVQVVDGVAVKANFTAHHSMDDNDVAFVAIDKNGDAVGFVFAARMANN